MYLAVNLWLEIVSERWEVQVHQQNEKLMDNEQKNNVHFSHSSVLENCYFSS